MTTTVPSVPPQPPGLPLWARLVVWLVIVPAELLFPSYNRRPLVRALLWSRWRLALLRLRVRWRRAFWDGYNGH